MKKLKPKVKEKKKDEDNFDYMKTNKDNIKNIIKNTDILPIINDLVTRTNKIIIHSYQFLKLYLINLYDNNIDFPLIDKEFLCDIFKVITKRISNKGAYTEQNMPFQLRTLTNFYDNNYIQSIFDNEIIYYDKLSYILPYEAIDMITNIHNNIQEHFLQHLFKYVHIVFDIKNKSNQITLDNKDKTIRKQLHKELYDEIQKVKNDLISFSDELTSLPKYHNWILQERLNLYRNKTNFDNDSIYYDLKSNTMDYLKSMFYLSRKFEQFNNDIIQYNLINEVKKKQIRNFNVLPLRTNIIPKNICIDTCALISNFLGDIPTKDYLKNYKIGNNQFMLWDNFFKLNKKSFRKDKSKYIFNYMIRTDGISCSILFIRVDDNCIPLKKTIKNKKSSEEINFDYIENIILTEELRNKRIICCDPGESDLLYCGSYNKNNELETFRYTQNQRRLETRNKKYNKLTDKLNKETYIENKTVKELETSLTTLNSKTTDYNNFLNYIIEKNKINIKLYNHYEQYIFRKLKLNRFINTQKSENKMINNFRNKFGKPEETIFIIGDYDKGDYHRKGKEPTILRKFRRIFKNAKYNTYLINEFRTSKICSSCNGELDKFLERESNKPQLKKENKKEIVHGLLRCQSIKPKCEKIHNRDKNAVQNMLNIVSSIFERGKRPEIFCRAIGS